MWYIDLASTGVPVGNVTELAIGFERIGAVGGQGMILLDSIRLYSYDRQLIMPIQPDTVGLQARYQFEGNTNDSSSNWGIGLAAEGICAFFKREIYYSVAAVANAANAAEFL